MARDSMVEKWFTTELAFSCASVANLYTAAACVARSSLAAHPARCRCSEFLHNCKQQHMCSSSCLLQLLSMVPSSLLKFLHAVRPFDCSILFVSLGTTVDTTALDTFLVFCAHMHCAVLYVFTCGNGSFAKCKVSHTIMGTAPSLLLVILGSFRVARGFICITQ